MNVRKLVNLCAVGVLTLSMSGSSKTTSGVQPPLPAPQQVTLGSVYRTDITTSRSFENLEAPAQTITTTGYSTIMVQYFASARLIGLRTDMSIRGVVDGTPIFPGPMRVESTDTLTISYAGYLARVAPGTHVVGMQWQATEGTAYMGGRTFIVWVFPS